MKKRFLAALATGLLVVGIGGVAQAALYIDSDPGPGTNFVDVGGLDDFIAQATQAEVFGMSPIPGEENDELAWLNSVIPGGDYTMDEYTKFDSSSIFLPVYSDTDPLTLADPAVAAFALVDQPDYFLVKTGNNATTPDYRFFAFANNVNLDYAVFQLQTEGYYIKNIGALSHAAQVGGGNEVPEPATMLLFGTGLAGLAGIARRRKKA